MKKKMIVVTAALLVATAALPCFAEIRVKREGATVKNTTVNIAIYWNDKYCSPSFPRAKELARLGKDTDVITTYHEYFDDEGFYLVNFYHLKSVDYVIVMAKYTYDNGYTKELYLQGFDSLNAAKKKFDSLCQQYYNEIPR